MTSDGKGSGIRIPSLFIGHQAGMTLSHLLAIYENNVTLRVFTTANQVGNQPLVIPEYSGRGPTVFGSLKPDLVAPGDHIMSQGYGPTALDTGRHLAFGQTSGTSMAAPFVAGAVALLKEKYPGWSNDRIRSALMNTARYHGIVNPDGSVAQPLDMGAGLIDIEAALATQLQLAPTQVDFGHLRHIPEVGAARTVRLTNLGTAPATYELSAVRLTHTGPEPLPGITVEPTAIDLEAGASAMVTLTLDPTGIPVPSFLQGHLVITGADTAYHAPVFAWLDLRPVHQPLVLIDADFSPLHPDYATWYREALDDLNLDYIYWDTARHEQKIPPWIHTDNGPAVIVLFTGDHVPGKSADPMPTSFPTTDLARLEQYVRQGGALWILGKNADQVLAGSDLLQYILGPATIQRRSDDRLGLVRPQVAAVPGAPSAWQETDLDVGFHEQALGTVNLITGDDIQAWGWDGQYLMGMATYALDNLRQHLRYEIYVQGSGEFQIESAQFHRQTDQGTSEPVQDLLGDHAPLSVNGTFRWNGILPLSAALHQSRLAGNLELRLVLEGEPQVTLATRVPTPEITSDSAGGVLPLHGIQGTVGDSSLVPILGITPDPERVPWVVGVSRLPGTDGTAGPILFTTFGLEHVNDAQAVTTRTMLLHTALTYLYPDLDIPQPASPAQ